MCVIELKDGFDHPLAFLNYHLYICSKYLASYGTNADTSVSIHISLYLKYVIYRNLNWNFLSCYKSCCFLKDQSLSIGPFQIKPINTNATSFYIANCYKGQFYRELIKRPIPSAEMLTDSPSGKKNVLSIL